MTKEDFMLVHHFLENSAAQYAEKIAVIHDGARATYDFINSRADSLGRHLSVNGIGKGDRIALLLENSIDYVVSYYAILKSGAVAAPLNPGLKPDGLQYLLKDLEPAVIISSNKSERLLKAVDLKQAALKLIVIKDPKQKWGGEAVRVSTFEEAVAEPGTFPEPPGLNANDPASIIYTSGSTGKPKGVVLSHGNIVSNTVSICSYLALTSDDVQMIILPFFYVMGKSLLNTHIAAGGSVVINNRFLYPADVVHQMSDEAVTGFSGVPSTYAYLLNRSPLAAYRDKMPALRYCSQAGGHMALSVKQALRRALPGHTRIFVMYGATEAAARLTYLDPDFFEAKMSSIGKPIPGVIIRILDEQGNEMPDGVEGELVASGPNIMQGYWKDPQETAKSLCAFGYKTGDIGYRDSDGFLYVLRRKDGMIKTRGHRVNPIEIEDVMLSTGMLVEVAVLGLPDKLMGNKLVALAVAREENCNLDLLMEKCAGSLPNYKLPSDVILSRALPKNANGKIDRQQCRVVIESAIAR